VCRLAADFWWAALDGQTPRNVDSGWLDDLLQWFGLPDPSELSGDRHRAQLDMAAFAAPCEQVAAAAREAVGREGTEAGSVSRFQTILRSADRAIGELGATTNLLLKRLEQDKAGCQALPPMAMVPSIGRHYEGFGEHAQWQVRQLVRLAGLAADLQLKAAPKHAGTF